MTPKKEKRHLLAVPLTAEQMKRLDAYCKAAGTNRAALVRTLILAALGEVEQ